ncbi:MAG: hypothetical protein IJD22_00215 [Clostridia bacterium]|nr:hypothetical protein [Clostridia bacterium]
MKKLIVPASVRKKAVKKVYGHLLKLAFYLLLAYIAAEYMYEGLKTTNFGNLSSTVFVIFLIPFWASGVPFKLIDCDWYGEIIKIELENSAPEKIDNHSAPPVTQKALVKCDNGKLYEVDIYDEGEYFFGEREKVYQVGDKVLHVRWTDYITPVRTKASAHRPVACVICGSKSPFGTKECRFCNSSMEITVRKDEVKK